MSKKDKENTKNIAQDLIKDGNITISAASRQELYQAACQLVTDIPADVNWMRGCVIYDNGAFHQTYSINK